jgi:hypothetical protein
MDYLEEVFLKARRIYDPADRASYLWDACCGDTNFLERVQVMLSEATGWTPSSPSSETEYSEQ